MGRRLNDRLLLKVLANEQEGATLRMIQAKMKRQLKWLMSVAKPQALEIIEQEVKFGHVQVVQARGRKAIRYHATAKGREWLKQHPWGG